MKLGRFISITEVEQTIQQFFETDWWVAYLASVIAAHNADPSAHLGAVNVPCLYLTMADQVIPTNVVTPISWGTQVYDAEGFWAAGDPTNINIPLAKKGLYLVSIYLFMANALMGNQFQVWVPTDGGGFEHNVNASEGVHTQAAIAQHILVTAATALHVDILTDTYADNPVLDFGALILTRLRAI